MTDCLASVAFAPSFLLLIIDTCELLQQGFSNSQNPKTCPLFIRGAKPRRIPTNLRRTERRDEPEMIVEE